MALISSPHLSKCTQPCQTRFSISLSLSVRAFRSKRVNSSGRLNPRSIAIEVAMPSYNQDNRSFALRWLPVKSLAWEVFPMPNSLSARSKVAWQVFTWLRWYIESAPFVSMTHRIYKSFPLMYSQKWYTGEIKRICRNRSDKMGAYLATFLPGWRALDW